MANDPQTQTVTIYRPFAQLPPLPDSSLETGTRFVCTDRALAFYLSIANDVQSWKADAGGASDPRSVTIFADEVSGNDANPGTQPLPVKTLQAAQDLAGAAIATIFCQPGDYTFPGGGNAWMINPGPTPRDLSAITTPYQRLTGPEPLVLVSGASLTGASGGTVFTLALAMIAGQYQGCFLRLEDGSGAELRIVDNDGAGNVETLGGFGPIGGTVKVSIIKAQVRVHGFASFAGTGALALQCVDFMDGDNFQGTMDVIRDRCTTYTSARASFPGFEGTRFDVGTVDPLAPPTSDTTSYYASTSGLGGSVNILRKGAITSSGLLVYFCWMRVFDGCFVGSRPFVGRRSPVHIESACQVTLVMGHAHGGITGIRNGDTYVTEGGPVIAGTDFFEGIFADNSQVYGDIAVDDNELGGMTLLDNGYSAETFHGANSGGPGRIIGGKSATEYADFGDGTLLGSNPGVDDVLLGINQFTGGGGVLYSYANVAAGTDQSISDNQGNVITQAFP